MAFASSLDQIGPMARTAEDAALLLEVHRRPRSAGCDLRRTCPCRAYSRAIAEPLAAAHAGRGARTVRSRPGLRGRRGGRAGDRHVSRAGRAFARCVAPAQPLRHRHLLHHRPVRGVEQSGALRRRALRLSHRRRRRCCEELADERRGRRSSADDVDSALLRMYRRTRAEGFGPR